MYIAQLNGTTPALFSPFIIDKSMQGQRHLTLVRLNELVLFDEILRMGEEITLDDVIISHPTPSH